MIERSTAISFPQELKCATPRTFVERLRTEESIILFRQSVRKKCPRMRQLRRALFRPRFSPRKNIGPHIRVFQFGVLGGGARQTPRPPVEPPVHPVGWVLVEVAAAVRRPGCCRSRLPLVPPEGRALS